MECPLCNKQKIKYVEAEKNGYKLYKCLYCHLYFINPIPGKGDLIKFYSSYLEEKKYKYSNKELREYRIKKLWQNRYKHINKYYRINKNTKVLEVGPGSGEWIETLVNNNVKNFTGIELSNDEYRLLDNKYGEKIIHKDLLNYFNSKRFDIIFLWDVLEHLRDIKSNIIHLKNLLKKDGILVFSVPNINSVSWLLLKGKWRFFIPPEHIYYYNYKNIKYFAKKFNFKIISFNTKTQLQSFVPNKDIDVFKGKKINIKFYKIKIYLEKFFSIFCYHSGDIITCILRNKN